MEEMKEKETVCEAEKENQTEEQPAKKEPKLKKKKDAELEKAREEISRQRKVSCTRLRFRAPKL